MLIDAAADYFSPDADAARIFCCLRYCRQLISLSLMLSARARQRARC